MPTSGRNVGERQSAGTCWCARKIVGSRQVKAQVIVSIISGLPSDHKVLLMLNSPDVVDWTQPGSEFNFDMNLLTEEEFRAEKGLPVV